MDLKKQLLSKLLKEFPKVKFKTTKLITKGWDHDVLVLDNKLIFRFAKNRIYKNSIKREVKFLSDFSKITNIKVPKYTYFSRRGNFGGYKMIQGKELSPKIYQNLSAKKKLEFIKKLAKFLSKLHSIPVSEAEKYDYKASKSWKGMQKDRKEWYKKKFKPTVSEKLTKTQTNFIENFVKNFYKSSYSFKPVFGHYDLGHDHILMKPDGSISGIIDFGDMHVSDPAYEFNGFFDYDESLPRQIYKYYRGPKDSKFLERAKKYYIHRYIYLLYDGLIRRKSPALWKGANQQINKIIKTSIL